MTGYGKAEFNIKGRNLRIEIKSLNSKSFDLNLRVPSRYRGLELNVRKNLIALLHRGKCEVNVFEQRVEGDDSASLNKEVIRQYINELNSIKPLSNEVLLPTVMKMPNVFKPINDDISDQEHETFLNTLKNAAMELVSYRANEGTSIENDLKNQLNQIQDELQIISQKTESRTELRRKKLEDQLQQTTLNFDRERLEQELVYYLEKLDINEELVRLNHHLDYFKTTMEDQNPTKGKKLGFIAQEIGREINTIGSKANDSLIQKSVVMMKDSLERIKEQVLNAL